MDEQKITETFVVEKIKEFLIAKQNGNWHDENFRLALTWCRYSYDWWK